MTFLPVDGLGYEPLPHPKRRGPSIEIHRRSIAKETGGTTVGFLADFFMQ
jgi:hypothetical protein